MPNMAELGVSLHAQNKRYVYNKKYCHYSAR